VRVDPRASRTIRPQEVPSSRIPRRAASTRSRSSDVRGVLSLRAAHRLNPESTPMDQTTRTPRRSQRRMAPSLDQLESRQLLSATPVHSHAEALRHHRAAMVEKAHEAHHASAKVSAAATPPQPASASPRARSSPTGCSRRQRRSPTTTSGRSAMTTCKSQRRHSTPRLPSTSMGRAGASSRRLPCPAEG
jgi:hypothetical protein